MKKFFKNHWNNKVVELHYKNWKIKAIAKYTGITVARIKTIIGQYESFVTRNYNPITHSIHLGSKNEPYYMTEDDYFHPNYLFTPFDTEQTIEVDNEHLDQNYQRFIAGNYMMKK